MADIGNVEIAMEGILVWSACIVGNFELRLALCWAVVEVDIAALVEAVVRGARGWVIEVVVNVCEAAQVESALVQILEA